MHSNIQATNKKTLATSTTTENLNMSFYDHVNLCIFVIHRFSFWFVFLLLLLQFYLDFLFCGSQSFSSFKYAVYCSLSLFVSITVWICNCFQSFILTPQCFFLSISQPVDFWVWITFFFSFSSSPPPSPTLLVHSTFYPEFAFHCTVPFLLGH